MNAWRTGLPRIIDDVRAEFEVLDIREPAGLEQARQTGFVWTRQPGVVCLASDRRYARMAADNPDARVVITANTRNADAVPGKTVIVCRQAEALYLHLHASQEGDAAEDCFEVDDSAVVDASAVLRGRVRIGPGVRIGPRAVICGPATLHAGACIEPGAIIGCEGLYAKPLRGIRQHIPHFGGVEIGEHAFIHASAVIVRSAIKGEATRVGPRAHIGVMTNIGHDAVIDEDATISSHCVIAGRARVGARAWIGASATISNMVSIGEDANVLIGAVVIRDVPAHTSVSGNFADDHARVMRRYLKETNHAP